MTKAENKSLKLLSEKYLPRLQGYERAMEIFGDRQSYSKVDPDATFMRTKDDHMKNGQLKACYNVQISTENQIITHFSLHQKPNDMTVLAPHLEGYTESQITQIDSLVMDAGYGSEENYLLIKSLEKKAYCPYPGMLAEEKRSFKKDISKQQNYYYNQQQDFFVCPMGQKMTKIGIKKEKTTTGFIQEKSVYQAKNCNNCPIRGACHQSKTNKRIEVNHNLKKLKEIMKARLESEIGKEIYKKRKIEPEPVFGNLKQNMKLTRFSLRTLPKVKLEFALFAIAHNIKKLLAFLLYWLSYHLKSFIFFFVTITKIIKAVTFRDSLFFYLILNFCILFIISLLALILKKLI